MRILVTAAAILGMSSTASAQGALDDWAGVYRFNHQIAFSSDPELFDAENILEIVPVSATQAYVRANITGHNADHCKFYGVASLVGDRLVYTGQPESFLERKRIDPSQDRLETASVTDHCELVVSRGADDKGQPIILLGDENNRCKARCGHRAYFDGMSWPTKSRRDIGYMAIVRASREYAEALKEARLTPVP